MSITARIIKGAIAGAAGTTALNAATYLDMAARGRPTSDLPEQTIEKLAQKASLEIPGDAHTRPNRVSGLAALNGLAAGVMAGAVLGALGFGGARPGRLITTVTATLAAMGPSNASMASLGLTDPRHWSAADWASDVVPHLAYGWVTAAALRRLDGA